MVDEAAFDPAVADAARVERGSRVRDEAGDAASVLGEEEEVPGFGELLQLVEAYELVLVALVVELRFFVLAVTEADGGAGREAPAVGIALPASP